MQYVSWSDIYFWALVKDSPLYSVPRVGEKLVDGRTMSV